MASNEGQPAYIERPIATAGTLGHSTAVGLLVTYMVIYVAPLYMYRGNRPSPTLSRDSPFVIRSRILSASISTILCSLCTFHILRNSSASRMHPLRLMGWWPIQTGDVMRSMVLICLLYTGPLFEAIVINGGWRCLATPSWLRFMWGDWPTWRNLIAGPVTEESLFRSSSVPLLLLAGMSSKKIIITAPFVFGLAHIHHYYEFRATHPHVSVTVAAARSALQFTYTTLFGAYATFLFLRTGSLLSTILVHSFCNMMGLPRCWGRVHPHWVSDNQSGHHAVAWKWTCLYYVLLAIGCTGWWWQLLALTDSSGHLNAWTRVL